MRESRLEEHNLLLTRKISTSLYSNVIEIEDSLENQGHVPFEFMLLYHINFGYPFIDETAQVIIESNGKIQGRTAYAAGRTEYYERIEPVEDGVEEEVFFHEVLPDAEGFSHAKIVNPPLHMGAEVLYSYDTLPILAQWKFSAPGEYVLGIEPGNSHIEGRNAGQEHSMLKEIQPGETIHFTVRIRYFDLPERP